MYSNQDGTRYGWFIFKHEARAKARSFLRKAEPGATILIQAIDIPGTRQGVHAALEMFATRGD